MKKHLLKTMLVATGLLAGAVSSWADTTDLSPTQTTQIKSANADNIMYNASATSWTCSQSKISNGAFTAPDSKGNYPGPIILTKFDASSTLSGQKLTKATLSFKSKCTVSKKNSNVQVAQINTGWDATTATWTNTNTATVLNAVNIDETTNGVNVSTSSKTITLDVTSYLNASTDNTIGFAIYTYTAREQSVSEIKLSLEYLDASSVSSYTVKYVDANGNELKTSTTATGTAGQKAELTETEKAAIYSTDGKKYVYSSDDSDSYTIATDGSTVITVKFREAETWNYTVKCIDSNSTTLKEIKGSALEGETVTPAYPYALNVDGTLYTTDKTQSSDQKGFQMSFALSKDNLEKSITYKATKTTGIVYFSEAEDIEGVTVCNNGNTAIRSSNGSSAYVAAEDGIALTKLTAGTYKINTVLCDATKNLNGEFKFAVGSQELSVTSTVVNWDEKSTQEFTVTEETEVRIQKSGNNTQGLDLIYIQKVGEVVSVTDAKYATLVTTQAVVVPESVKVLAVKAGATGITTTEVAAGTVLPAKTAVLVNAEEGNYAFTVSSETGTALENNDLKPGTGSAATGTQYCLTKTDDGKVGFAKVATTVTIPTTKAYLEVSSEYASVNFFALDDNTATAIKSIEAAQAANGTYYTLQGVKVEKPTKGIYVHNGKKVVIK